MFVPPSQWGGLNLIDAEEAMYALLTKWIIKALGLGDSNLQVALRHHLTRLQLDWRGRWPDSLKWTVTHKFIKYHGHQVSNQLLLAWRKFVPELDFATPKNKFEVFSTPLWYMTQFYSSSFGFSLVRVANLTRQGLQFI